MFSDPSLRERLEPRSLAVAVCAVDTKVGVGSGPLAAFIATAWVERRAKPTEGFGASRNTEYTFFWSTQG